MMKKLIFLWIIPVLLMASCDIYIDEEPRRRDDRNRWTGDYRIEENSDTYGIIASYRIEIRKSYSYANRVYIDNFYDSGIEVYANISGNRITIPLQRVYGYEISGRGQVYGDEIELFYEVTDLESYRLVTDYCDAIAWRRY